MRLYSLITLLLATATLAEPTLNNKRTDQLTSPFLHRRSDLVVTRDGRLISRQDVGIFSCVPFMSCSDRSSCTMQCCEDPPGCGCSSAVSCTSTTPSSIHYIVWMLSDLHYA